MTMNMKRSGDGGQVSRKRRTEERFHGKGGQRPGVTEKAHGCESSVWILHVNLGFESWWILHVHPGCESWWILGENPWFELWVWILHVYPWLVHICLNSFIYVCPVRNCVISVRRMKCCTCFVCHQISPLTFCSNRHFPVYVTLQLQCWFYFISKTYLLLVLCLQW